MDQIEQNILLPEELVKEREKQSDWKKHLGAEINNVEFNDVNLWGYNYYGFTYFVTS